VINAAEAFELINNLDRREAIRRFGPAWSLVVVNEALEIVALGRFKERPTVVQVDELVSEHKGSAYFYANPGVYKTVEALEARVRECEDAFRIDWQSPKQ